MRPDERDVITRPFVASRLAREGKFQIIGALIPLLPEVALAFLTAHLAERVAAPDFVFPAVLATLLALFAVLAAVHILPALSLLRLARSGRFTVQEDELLEVKDDHYSLLRALFYSPSAFSRRDSAVDIFRFVSGRTYTVASSQNRGTRLDAAAKFSTTGDRFYVVVADDRPEKLLLLYSQKVFVYRENG